MWWIDVLFISLSYLLVRLLWRAFLGLGGELQSLWETCPEYDARSLLKPLCQCEHCDGSGNCKYSGKRCRLLCESEKNEHAKK